MEKVTMSEDRVQVLYEQVCSQHDGIADFRAKLLALLPIASGAGIFLLFEKGGIPSALSPHLVAIGLFGIAVTTGSSSMSSEGSRNATPSSRQQ